MEGADFPVRETSFTQELSNRIRIRPRGTVFMGTESCGRRRCREMGNDLLFIYFPLGAFTFH